MKRKIIVIIIFLITSFIYQKASPGWITSWGIDPTSYLFFSLLPIIWLFKLSSRINGLVAIFFLVVMAFSSIAKYDPLAENMAIMAFFFFTTSVCQQIGGLVRLKNSDDNNT